MPTAWCRFAFTSWGSSYEDAFRKIGLKLEDLNPQKVIEACIAQVDNAPSYISGLFTDLLV